LDDECKCLELLLAVAEVGVKMGLETNSLVLRRSSVLPPLLCFGGELLSWLSEHAEDA